jgi:hypothetical protein
VTGNYYYYFVFVKYTLRCNRNGDHKNHYFVSMWSLPLFHVASLLKCTMLNPAGNRVF